MRIAHYMREMFEPGGIASYIRRISAAQKQLGHEVLFFDRLPQKHTSPEHVEFIIDDIDLMLEAQVRKLDILHVHCDVDLFTFKVPVIRTVHTHSPYCPSQGRFLKNPGCPCDRNYSLLGCLWGHAVNRCGSLRPTALTRNFKTVRTERRTLPNIRSIAISEFAKQQMIRAGYPADRIEVLLNPAPAATDYTAPPENGPPRFVFLGRMIPHKGVDWLLRSISHLRADATFDLAGTGNQEAEYRVLAKQLGLEQRVTFHGWLAPDAAQQLVKNARALIFPSIWHEPGGLVALEAMANGRAVIASQVGGLTEIFADQQSGLLVPPGDAPALAAAIDRLAADHDLARRLGQTGRQRALDHHSLESHVQSLLALYAHPV
jgi:glycosyltransferase involved in cell wall biosynthesis